jgi:hypothetical protein
MAWQPGQPIITAADEAQWREWKRARKLEGQRWRRQRYRRIDYYPGENAQAAIDARTHSGCGGNYSAVLDALVLAGAEALRRRVGRIPE